LRGATLLTNDARARTAAGKQEVEVSGSLGILRYAVEAGRLTPTEAVAMLDTIVEEGAWISADLVEQFRREMRGKE
jgi:predicted nucleic acid-binding protein